MFVVRGPVALLAMLAVAAGVVWSFSWQAERHSERRSTVRTSSGLRAQTAARLYVLAAVDFRTRAGRFPSSRAELPSVGAIADGFEVAVSGSTSDFSVRVGHGSVWFMGYVDAARGRVAATCSAPVGAGCDGGGWDLRIALR